MGDAVHSSRFAVRGLLDPEVVAWPVCFCGEPVVLMERTGHPLQMRTECCGALYELRAGLGLVLLEEGRRTEALTTDGTDLTDGPEVEGGGRDLRPVLALDCDGVLNGCGAEIGSIMPGKLELLREIVERTGCRVLIISSWRFAPGQLARLRAVLMAEGIGCEVLPGVEAIGNPRSLLRGCSCKGGDLALWRAGQPAGLRLVVLDDAPLPDFGGCQVVPDSGVGLTPALVDLVCERLNNAGGVVS